MKHQNLLIFIKNCLINIGILALILSYNFTLGQTVRRVVISPNEISNALEQKNSTDSLIIVLKSGTYKNFQLPIKGIKRLLITKDSGGKVVFSGNTSVMIHSSENVTLENLEFNYTNSKDVISIIGSTKVSIIKNKFSFNQGGRYARLVAVKNGSKKTIVTRNTFDNNRTMGVVVEDGCINSVISFNKFLNVPDINKVYGVSNGMESIQLGQKGLSGTTSVFSNYFENIIGDRSEIISVKSSNNEIFSNTFINSSGGVTLRLGKSNKISSNSFYSTTNSIRVFGEGHSIIDNYIEDAIYGIQLPAGDTDINQSNSAGYLVAKKILIKNNTIVRSRKNAILMGNGHSKSRKYLPSEVQIFNNTFDKSSWLQKNNEQHVSEKGNLINASYKRKAVNKNW